MKETTKLRIEGEVYDAIDVISCKYDGKQHLTILMTFNNCLPFRLGEYININGYLFWVTELRMLKDYQSYEVNCFRLL